MAASTVLQGLLGVDAASHAMVASAQRQRIEAAIRQSKNCSIQDMAGLSQAISSAAFPPDDKKALMMALASTSPVSPASATSESARQNSESVSTFLPASVTDRVGTIAFSTSLLQFVFKLGLRRPSEYTYRELALISLVGTDGMDRALQMSSQTRNSMMESMKLLFKRAATNMPPASPYLPTLPATPRDLEILHKDFFDGLYGGDPIKPLEVDSVQYQLLRSGTPCRKERNGFSKSSASAGSSANGGMVSWADLNTIMATMQGRHIAPSLGQQSLPGLHIFGKGDGSPLQRSVLSRVGASDHPTPGGQPLPLTSPGRASPMQALQAAQATSLGQGSPSQAVPVTSAGQASFVQAVGETSPGQASPLQANLVAIQSEVQEEQRVRERQLASGSNLDQALEQIEEVMAKKKEDQRERAAQNRKSQAAAKQVLKRPSAAMEPGSKRVCLGHERTRFQWTVRIEGQPTKAFRYGKHGEPSAMKEQAMDFIREQCEELKLPVPSQYL